MRGGATLEAVCVGRVRALWRGDIRVTPSHITLAIRSGESATQLVRGVGNLYWEERGCVCVCGVGGGGGGGGVLALRRGGFSRFEGWSNFRDCGAGRGDPHVQGNGD